MTGPSSDGNETGIDIFIVTADETVGLLLKEHLEQRDYHVCVFSDSAHLDDTLRAEKPDLLICDVSTREPDGYEFVCHIKTDEELRELPVLVLTNASTMDDLLKVLESNADNFIAPPYNLPDRLSLIDSMLNTPVERQPPDLKEKQFRIRHDDRVYVVTGNSKKLLEYLLSSFDIVVSTSSGLSQVTSKIKDLSESAEEMERTITSQAQVIDTVNGDLREKEQKITGLIQQCRLLERTLEQKTEEIADLMKKYDDTRNLVASRDEALLAMTRDKDEALITYRSHIDALNKRVSTLAEEADTVRSNHDTLQKALNEETTRNVSLETALRDLRQDQETQKSAFEAERERAISTELEMKELMQAKTQTEKDLNQIITDLRETGDQQATKLNRLKEELEKETSRRVSMENQALLVRQDFEQKGLAQRAESERLNGQVTSLQEALASTAAELETERELRHTSEEKTKAVVQDLENLKNNIQAANEEIERARNSQTTIISQLTEELENAGNRIKSLQSEVDILANEKMQAEQQVRVITSDAGHPGAEPASVASRQTGSEEGDDAAVNQRHLVQQSLFQSAMVNTPKERRELVVSEGAHLPVCKEKASQPTVKQQTPGSGNHLASDGPAGEISPEFSGVIPTLSGVPGAEKVPDRDESMIPDVNPVPGPLKDDSPGGEKLMEESLSEEHTVENRERETPAFHEGEQSENVISEGLNIAGFGTGSREQSDLTFQKSGGPVPGGEISFDRNQWLDLLKWAHHSGALSPDQRQKIIRMGRLIQKDRKLTNKQQDQIKEMLASIYALGYHPP